MDSEHILLTGCRENNLKDVSLAIPKRKITVFTGVSGSGKSSVVFDTITQEAGRQLNENFSYMVRMFLPRYRQPDADAIQNLCAAAVIDQHRLGGNPRSTLGTITDINTLLRLFFSRLGSPHIGYGNAFSFNEPRGMCRKCQGIGRVMELDVEKALDEDKNLNEGAILLPGFAPGSVHWNLYAGTGFFDLDKKLRDYTMAEKNRLLYAKPEKLPTQRGGTPVTLTYEGLARRFVRLGSAAGKEDMDKARAKSQRFAKTARCPACKGKRYSPRVLGVTYRGHNLYDLTAMQLDELSAVLHSFEDDPAAVPLVKAITGRLQILINMGLDYMSLTRETATLSGGESQRVKMVRHLTSSLTDMLYIFDEPSIGLHPRDVHRMNELLVRLRDKGNTVLVVEHDPDVIAMADHVVDMGPGAGAHGGQVVYEGSYGGLTASGTLTAQYLQKQYPIKEDPRLAVEFLESRPSTLHNLKNARLRVPKAAFTVVTGVAGSGKSTLVNEVFAVQHPGAVRIDQSPVNVNSRSNPATYIGIMDAIRKAFAAENGANAGLFSYNSQGACPSCGGSGVVEVNLSYMDTVAEPCEDCGDTRFAPAVLQYTLRGQTIVQVLAMTAAEALDFFTEPAITKPLANLSEVGLGYMTLGQPLSTLSGGEAQRIKLARELGKHGSLYILDEPTTGLHRSDIQRILAVIDRLVDAGNTVIAIEHNLDVVKHADWVVDLGPEGGSRGGQVLYEGPVAGLMACQASHSGRYLKASLP